MVILFRHYHGFSILKYTGRLRATTILLQKTEGSVVHLAELQLPDLVTEYYYRGHHDQRGTLFSARSMHGTARHSGHGA